MWPLMVPAPLVLTGKDNMQVLDDTEVTDHQMTEEEWSQRVAELNKHQVSWSSQKQHPSSAEVRGLERIQYLF